MGDNEVGYRDRELGSRDDRFPLARTVSMRLPNTVTCRVTYQSKIPS